ncbi:MAG TPA: glycosyltransferase [Vitreimonas sp.]|nr:glycosyltransferase [Vitreimonas sp.]
MNRTRIPEDVLSAAHARASARQARDWAEADRLRDLIEAAGWKVVDRGTDFALSPAHPPDLREDGRVRHGSSQSVPARFDDAPVGLASVVAVATDAPGDLERALAPLRDHAPDGTQIVIVGNDPAPDQVAALEALEALDPGGPGVATEVVWTSARLGHAAALNAGIRRAAAPVVVVLDTSIEPAGDVITPLVGALGDPAVAVAGPYGIVSDDLRRFREGSAGDVDAIEGYLLAFRRSDYADRGPLDERFVFYRNLDIWWSLVLRDGGEEGDHRRAVMVDGLPLVRHEHRGYASLPEAERERLSKRNFYRIIDRFGSRRDLLTAR